MTHMRRALFWYFCLPRYAQANAVHTRLRTRTRGIGVPCRAMAGGKIIDEELNVLVVKSEMGSSVRAWMLKLIGHNRITACLLCLCRIPSHRTHARLHHQNNAKDLNLDGI